MPGEKTTYNGLRLCRLLKAQGYKEIKVWYGPRTRALEMCGPGGGWYFEAVDGEGDFKDGWLGYNIKEALERAGSL